MFGGQSCSQVHRRHPQACRPNKALTSHFHRQVNAFNDVLFPVFVLFRKEIQQYETSALHALNIHTRIRNAEIGVQQCMRITRNGFACLNNTSSPHTQYTQITLNTNTTQHNTTQHNTTQHNTTQHTMTLSVWFARQCRVGRDGVLGALDKSSTWSLWRRT